MNLKHKLKWLFAEKELNELYSLKTELQLYRRWLGEFEGISMVLDNIASKHGVIDASLGLHRIIGISELREQLRKLNKLGEHQ